MNEGYQVWVDRLGLLPHPEGGFYKETYRSKEVISHSALPNRFAGDRNFSTAIYFLLTGENFSAFHKIAADELWHFYAGDGLTISIIHPKGELENIKLGSNPHKGEVFQSMVPAESWFASQPSNKIGWALVGCTVAPGFDFADFQMAKRAELIQDFPSLTKTINSLTRQ